MQVANKSHRIEIRSLVDLHVILKPPQHINFIVYKCKKTLDYKLLPEVIKAHMAVSITSYHAIAKPWFSDLMTHLHCCHHAVLAQAGHDRGSVGWGGHQLTGIIKPRPTYIVFQEVL